MNSSKNLVALLVIACCAGVSSVRAQVAFGPATTISGDADVYTAGTLVYAYDMSGTAATVNGVAFTAESCAANFGSVTTTFTACYGGYNSSSSPFSGLTSSYKTVLTGGIYRDATAVTVTLGGLTSGHTYAVQIWVDDSRGSSRTETVTSSGGNTVTLSYCVGGAGGGVGQYTIGTFLASGTT